MGLRAVLDTSPLQALWRARVLDQLPYLFKDTFIPSSVADETRWSLALVDKERVPSLKGHRWIQIEPVPSETLREAMASLFKSNHQRRRGAKVRSPQPEIAIVEGRVIAWTQPQDRLTFKVPDLEVVLLARLTGAVAILDDRKALRAALDLGVRTATTREVLGVMVQRGLIADAESAIEKMRATGYHPTVRATNVWDGTP